MQPARCAPSAPASPKGLRSLPAGDDHRAACGREKALLPSCGPLPGVLVARALAVCRCCRLTARPQDVAGVAGGLHGAESEEATCGGWPHDHESGERLPPPVLVPGRAAPLPRAGPAALDASAVPAPLPRV